MEFPLTQEEIQGLIDRQRAEIEELRTQLSVANSQLGSIREVVTAVERMTIEKVAYLVYSRRIVIEDRTSREIRDEIIARLPELENQHKESP